MTDNIKNVLRENMYMMLIAYLVDKRPFRILLWQDNEWDKPLPQKVLEDHPKILTLDILDHALDSSYVEESEIAIIVTKFGEIEYSRAILPENILGIVDFDQNFGAQQFNYFPPDEENMRAIRTYDDIVNTLTEVYEVPKTNAIKSLKAFKRDKEEGVK